jgi:hypothetical protein
MTQIKAFKTNETAINLLDVLYVGLAFTLREEYAYRLRVRFEFLKVVNITVVLLWFMARCRLAYQHLAETYCVYLPG